MAEVTNPSGIIDEVVGIEKGDRDDVCGVVVEEDTLLHLRRMQIQVDGHKETAIGCFGVTDGIDHCCVGFLKCHMLDGALAQVMKVFSAKPCHSDMAKWRICTTITMAVRLLLSC